MENGMKRVVGLEMSEKGHVENEVLGDKVESGVVLESGDTRDMEEEVFEEATDSQEQFQEVGAESDSGTNFETVGDSSSVVVDENSAVETFEEAVDIHDDAGIVKDLVDVVVENKVDELVVAETSNKIDDGGTPGEVGNDKPNAGKEISANEKPNAGKEVSEDFGLAGESKNGENVVLEAGDQKALHFQLESSGEILKESGKKEELKSDSPGNQENEGLIEPLIEPRESKVDEYKENLDYANEDNDKHLAKNEIGEDFKVQYDSNDIVNDTSVAAHSEGNGEPCQLKPVSAIVEAFSEESVVPEISSPPSSMNIVNEGIKEIHAYATNVVVVEETSKEIHVDANNLVVEESSKAVPVGAANLVVEERSKEIHADATNVVAEEKGEEIHNDATILVAEEKGKEIHDDAANLTAEDIKSAPLHANEKVDRFKNKNVMIEQPGNKAEKEVRPSESNSTPKLDSSSGRSASSTNPPARPAGLGRVAPLLEPAPRAVQPPRANGTVSHVQSQQAEDNNNADAEEYDETREKLQMIRVKFLRLAYRLGQTPHNVVVAQVLYRLGLAEQLRGRNGGRVGAFSFDRASAMAEQLEAAGQEPLDFSCTIMVLGKTGVGKSATINSIFDEAKFSTDAFHLGTTKVQDVVGTVQGIRVRVIDTPGLLPSGSDQRHNEKILHSVKRFIKKTPPDIVLYLDRLDMQSRDFGDMPLLRTITEIFGPSIWFNAIVVLTHAASAPPDGPNGTASSYDMFVTQRSHVVQQAIRQAAGDMRLMNPVSLVENHSACRTNRAGQRVLPNGQVWKPHLLLLSFASKILAEANALLKLQDSPPGKPFATRLRAPPLPFLLSSLLQSRPQVKLPEEQFGDDDGLDDDLDEASDSEDESEYDDLPPFRSLTKAQLGKLNKAQKKAYFEELELREKLFMKKQLKEEKKRRKMMKKMAAAAKDLPSEYSDSVEEESGGPASVPVPMPDLALPASFDSDNPTHRYRYLDSSNQWLVRPVLETHGWDHDVGYEGINVERLFVVKEKIPISFSGQVTKDKKDSNVQMEFASSLKHGEGKATSLGFDMQTMGKELAYTLRSETRFSNCRKNKATAGLSVTLMGDALSAGVKVEDKLIVDKRFQMVVSGGAMTGRGDVAYGGSLEAQLRDKDYPLGRSLSTLGLSVMDWHGDLAVGCNIQSQIPVGRSTNLIARANLNNRGAGQISVRLNTSEQLQIALLGIVPLLQKLFSYPQQVQFGQ